MTVPLVLRERERKRARELRLIKTDLQPQRSTAIIMSVILLAGRKKAITKKDRKVIR